MPAWSENPENGPRHRLLNIFYLNESVLVRRKLLTIRVSIQKAAFLRHSGGTCSFIYKAKRDGTVDVEVNDKTNAAVREPFQASDRDVFFDSMI